MNTWKNKKDTEEGDSVSGILTAANELALLWKQETFCDVVLHSKDGHCVKCHKILLAAVSPFFKALFTGAGREMVESLEDTIELKGVDAEGLKVITSAIYTDTLELTRANLKSVLEASNLFQISSIQNACFTYLAQNLSLENCMETLQSLEMYHAPQLLQRVVGFVRQNLSELVYHGKDLSSSMQGISKATLIQIFEYKQMTASAERDMLFFTIEWLRSNPEIANEDANEMLSRFNLDSEVIDVELRRTGLEKFIFSSRPKWYTPSSSLTSSSPRIHNQILIAGGHDTSWRTFMTTHKYDPCSDAWTSGLKMPGCYSLSAAASTGRNAYFVGGTMYSASLCRYDKWQETWSECDSFQVPRIQPAVANLGSALYVCGGRNKFGNASVCTEICNTHDGRWTRGPDLCLERFSFGAATLGGDIYAVGGQSARHAHDSVEVLNDGGENWVVLESKLATPRKYLSVVGIAGRIFAIGGMNAQRVRLSTVEALDPREGRWQSVASLSFARSSCGMAVLREKVYVVGGNSGDTVIHSTMECYVPEANVWLPCKNMNEARSGLSAVAI